MYMWRERSKEEKHEDVVNTGLLPLDVVEGFKIRPGFFRMYGACVASNGVSFTINSHGATRCTLLLFKPQASKPYARIPFPDSYRIGDTYSMLVFDIKPDEFEYAFSFDGPYEPAKGLLFNEENVLLDPYSRAVTGQRKWGEKPEGGKDFEYRARVVKSSFDWGNIKQLEQPFEDLVIYETHVRGYTKDKSSGVSAPGTFAGLKDKIPYLKDLGINAVELMPIFEFDEMESARVVDGVQLYNYWGYNTVSFFAPNTSYAFNEEHNHEGDELKSLIKALKENGIEVILDVVFNHTAEGNEMGPCFSFKGIDNNVYYMLTPDAHYYNFSGCGNVMNCNHPVVRSFIIDCLRHWAIEYRVDGFRFDLASILGRDQNGAPMANPPILESLAFDPVLGKMKLIAEAWDAGGLYQVGSFPSWNRWAEWNGRYRDDLRRFLKGDNHLAWDAAQRITGSRDLYDPTYRGYNASVNFLTCHDGFTLYDMYSYNEKHNLENGWNNTDGANDNNSWNCGAEGETDDYNINKLRIKMVKNAFATLMCSQGPALFLAGDEFCNTQFGNNNAYCQDNPTGWVNWSNEHSRRENIRFLTRLIKFRDEHPVISCPKPFKFSDYKAVGYPDLSYHCKNAWIGECDATKLCVGVMYCGDYNEVNKDYVYVAYNFYSSREKLALPKLKKGMKWYAVCDSTLKEPFYDTPVLCENQQYADVSPQSVYILIGR